MSHRAARLILLGLAFAGLSGCGDAQEAQLATSALPVMTDMRGAGPIKLDGVVWRNENSAAAFLQPVRQGETLWKIDGVALFGSAGGKWRGEPIAALTNTFEIDCVGQRHRKVAETYLSADARPLARSEYRDPPWSEGLFPAFRQACGDTSVEPGGLPFTDLAGLSDAYERMGLKTRVTVSGPTITTPE